MSYYWSRPYVRCQVCGRTTTYSLTLCNKCTDWADLEINKVEVSRRAETASDSISLKNHYRGIFQGRTRPLRGTVFLIAKPGSHP